MNQCLPTVHSHPQQRETTNRSHYCSKVSYESCKSYRIQLHCNGDKSFEDYESQESNGGSEHESDGYESEELLATDSEPESQDSTSSGQSNLRGDDEFEELFTTKTDRGRPCSRSVVKNQG